MAKSKKMEISLVKPRKVKLPGGNSVVSSLPDSEGETADPFCLCVDCEFRFDEKKAPRCPVAAILNTLCLCFDVTTSTLECGQKVKFEIEEADEGDDGEVDEEDSGAFDDDEGEGGESEGDEDGDGDEGDDEDGEEEGDDEGTDDSDEEGDDEGEENSGDDDDDDDEDGDWDLDDEDFDGIDD